MKILYDLIFCRITIREQLLDILLDLTSNENISVRNNARHIVKNLSEKNEFKESIEVKYKLKCSEHLRLSQLSETLFDNDKKSLISKKLF